MATVAELTAGYENFMLAPRRGPGVCEICFNLTDGFSRCFACTHHEPALAAVAPISYSVAHEQLHHALAAYKRLGGEVAAQLHRELAALLWRYLERHEACLAAAAGAAAFDLVATVPAGTPSRDRDQPLRRIVAGLVGPCRDRYQRLLTRTDGLAPARQFDPRRFVAARPLRGEAVLLIDDTWTTGASAQSAASVLRAAGAGDVAAVVIGRHVNRDWGENDRRLSAMSSPYDWERCVYCGESASVSRRRASAARIP